MLEAEVLGWLHLESHDVAPAIVVGAAPRSRRGYRSSRFGVEHIKNILGGSSEFD
jgi:hypothetical protein